MIHDLPEKIREMLKYNLQKNLMFFVYEEKQAKKRHARFQKTCIFSCFSQASMREKKKKKKKKNDLLGLEKIKVRKKWQEKEKRKSFFMFLFIYVFNLKMLNKLKK